MKEKINYLKAPYSFKQFYSNYPEGYSIYEALLNWLDEVNKMIDVLNLTLEEWNNLKEWINTELQSYAETQLLTWLNDGTLEGMINEVLFNSKLDKVELDELIVNVKDKRFGAKGDGVTDDTTAIQDAIDFCVLNKRKLFIPAGTYKHSGLVIPSKQFNMEGASREESILKYSGIGTALKIGDNVGNNADNSLTVYGSYFANFTVEGEGSKQCEYGISITRRTHTLFDKIYIKNAKTGFYIYGNDNDATPGNSVYNNIYRMVKITDCDYGFVVDGIISDSQFLDCHVGSISEYGIHFKNYVTTSWNVTLARCTFAGNMVVGVKKSVFFEDVHIRNFTVIGCDFENFTEIGVHIADPLGNKSAYNCTIANNSFLAKIGVTVSNGLKIDRGNNMSIHNNGFFNPITLDIELGVNAVYCMLYGNVGINRILTSNISATNTHIKQGYFGNQNVTRFERGISVQQGDFVVEETGKGIVLNSPDGSRWRLILADTGEVYTYKF